MIDCGRGYMLCLMGERFAGIPVRVTRSKLHIVGGGAPSMSSLRIPAVAPVVASSDGSIWRPERTPLFHEAFEEAAEEFEEELIPEDDLAPWAPLYSSTADLINERRRPLA